jgi:hypothetical protein
LLIEPQWGISIVNQQSKFNNQKFYVDRSSCGDGRLGRPSEGEAERHDHRASYPAINRRQ